MTMESVQAFLRRLIGMPIGFYFHSRISQKKVKFVRFSLLRLPHQCCGILICAFASAALAVNVQSSSMGGTNIAVKLTFIIEDHITSEDAAQFKLPQGMHETFFKAYFNSAGYRFSTATSESDLGAKYTVQYSNTITEVVNGIGKEFVLSDIGAASGIARIIECKAFLSDVEHYVVHWTQWPSDLSEAIADRQRELDLAAKMSKVRLDGFAENNQEGGGHVNWLSGVGHVPYVVSFGDGGGPRRSVRVAEFSIVSESGDSTAALLAPVEAKMERFVTSGGKAFVQNGKTVVNPPQIDVSNSPRRVIVVLALVFLSVCFLGVIIRQKLKQRETK